MRKHFFFFAVISILILSSGFLTSCQYVYMYPENPETPTTEKPGNPGTTDIGISDNLLKTMIMADINTTPSPTLKKVLRDLNVVETDAVVIQVLTEFIEAIREVVILEGDTSKVNYFVNAYWKSFITVLTQRINSAQSETDEESETTTETGEDDGDGEDGEVIPQNHAPEQQPSPPTSTENNFIVVSFSWGVNPETGEDVLPTTVRHNSDAGLHYAWTADFRMPNPLVIPSGYCINEPLIMNYATVSYFFESIQQFFLYWWTNGSHFYHPSWSWDFSEPITSNTPMPITVIWEREEV
jgi:hypothetical protein